MKNVKLLGKKSYWSQQLFFFTLPAHLGMASLEEQLALSGQLNSNTQRCRFSILRNIINKEITASCHRLPNYRNNNSLLSRLTGRSSQHSGGRRKHCTIFYSKKEAKCHCCYRLAAWECGAHVQQWYQIHLYSAKNGVRSKSVRAKALYFILQRHINSND